MTNTPTLARQEPHVAPLITVRDTFVRTFPQLDILATDLSDIVSAFHKAGATGIVSPRLEGFLSRWSTLRTQEEKRAEVVHQLKGRRCSRDPEMIAFALAWLDWRVQFHRIALGIFLDEQRDAEEAAQALMVGRKWEGDDLAVLDAQMVALMDRAVCWRNRVAIVQPRPSGAHA